jgi:hypothetical protein
MSPDEAVAIIRDGTDYLNPWCVVSAHRDASPARRLTTCSHPAWHKSRKQAEHLREDRRAVWDGTHRVRRMSAGLYVSTDRQGNVRSVVGQPHALIPYLLDGKIAPTKREAIEWGRFVLEYSANADADAPCGPLREITRELRHALDTLIKAVR